MSENKNAGKTDTLVKLLLVLFISLFSFSVGTFFGKKTTESTLKRAALESEADGDLERGTASLQPGAMEVKPEDALTSEELAKLSEEHEQAEKAEKSEPVAADEKKNIWAKENGEEHAGNAPNKDMQEKFQKVQKAAERVAAGKEPAPEPPATEKRKPSSLPPQVASSTIGKFTVQVSSHQSEAEATKRAEELKAKGFNAFFVKANVGGKKWYRVSVGLFTTRKEASDYVATVKKDAQINAAIVQKIVE